MPEERNHGGNGCQNSLNHIPASGHFNFTNTNATSGSIPSNLGPSASVPAHGKSHAPTHGEHASTSSSGSSLSTFSLFNIGGLKPRSVPSNVPAISDYLKETPHLFIALTETRLNYHLDAELHIQDFSLYQQDWKRKQKKFGRDSGGAAFNIRHD